MILEENQYDTDDIAEKYFIFKKNLFFSKIDVPTIKKLFNNDLSGKSVIDLACGVGSSTWILADLEPIKITGVDISPSMIQKAKQLSLDNVNYRKIDFHVRDCTQDLNLGHFDYVFSSHLLNYADTIEKLEKMANTIYNSVKPGGYGCGYLPNPFLKPQNNDKLLKYGFEVVKQEGNRVMSKFYDGDGNNKKYLFGVDFFYWDPEFYVKSFKKAGFTNFEWIQPIFEDGFEDKEGFFDDFFKYQPFMAFKAQKPF